MLKILPVFSRNYFFFFKLIDRYIYFSLFLITIDYTKHLSARFNNNNYSLFFYKNIWWKHLFEINKKKKLNKINKRKISFINFQNYNYEIKFNSLAYKNNNNFIFKNYNNSISYIFNSKMFFYMIYTLKNNFLYNLYFNYFFFLFINFFKFSNLNFKQQIINFFSDHASLRNMKNKNLLNFNFMLI